MLKLDFLQSKYNIDKAKVKNYKKKKINSKKNSQIYLNASLRLDIPTEEEELRNRPL